MVIWNHRLMTLKEGRFVGKAAAPAKLMVTQLQMRKNLADPLGLEPHGANMYFHFLILSLHGGDKPSLARLSGFNELVSAQKGCARLSDALNLVLMDDLVCDQCQILHECFGQEATRLGQGSKLPNRYFPQISR